MLSETREKLIKSLHLKKGRLKHGLCLVEGQKIIDMVGDLLEYSFGPEDSKQFDKLVTTETPQSQAAVARIPEFTEADVQARKITIVLDGVQDPGNVGAILRLCLGFEASLILIESADVTSPKVVRSSAGAMFKVPWIQVAREDAAALIKELDRPVYRLEKTTSAEKLGVANIKTPLILIAGSEGQGIKLEIKGRSIFVDHSSELESLNVGNALAIALYTLRQK